MKLILLLVACCGTALQTTSACADGDLEKLVDWFRVAEPGSRLCR